MSVRFASGKYASGECDRCGWVFKFKSLKKLTIRGEQVNIKVCPECFEKDHPQLMTGRYPVFDPEALKEPRVELGLESSGLNVNGNISQGSRVIEWGWNPVGYASNESNSLIAKAEVGKVTVSTSG